MKILLVGNYAPDLQQSMQRFSSLLEREVSAAGHEVRHVIPTARLGKNPSRRGAKWLGYADKLVLFPRELKTSLPWADLVHVCDHSNSFYTKQLKNIPHLVTCHDLLAVRSAKGEFPQHTTRFTGRIFQRIILAGLNQAEFVSCVSHKTREDLLRLTRIAPDRVSVIHNGLNYDYSPDPEAPRKLQELGLPAGLRFILHVGNNSWYKNRSGVLDVFQKLNGSELAEGLGDLHIVMAGKPFTAEMRRFVKDHGLENKVHELVSVSNESLRSLYSEALALLFPSFEEGFGWPIIEAQSCGCPVICGNQGSLPEVAGDAALIADPNDSDALARLVARVVLSDDLRADLRARGFANAAKFSTKFMVENYIRRYEDVLASYPLQAS